MSYAEAEAEVQARGASKRLDGGADSRRWVVERWTNSKLFENK